MKEKRFSILRWMGFGMITFVVSVIGVSLPETVNYINGLENTAFYGFLVSYMVSVILFWIIMKDFSFYTPKESYFKKILLELRKAQDRADKRTIMRKIMREATKKYK